MVDELAKYYALPSVSLRDVVWHRMKANATFHGLTLQQLYYDRIHPSDLGHTVLALALAHLFKRAALLAAALAQPHAAGTAAAAAAAVPRGCAAVPAQLLSPMDKTVDPASTALECFDAPVLGRLVDKPCRSRAQKGPRLGQAPLSACARLARWHGARPRTLELSCGRTPPHSAATEPSPGRLATQHLRLTVQAYARVGASCRALVGGATQARMDRDAARRLLPSPSSPRDLPLRPRPVTPTRRDPPFHPCPRPHPHDLAFELALTLPYHHTFARRARRHTFTPPFPPPNPH